MNNKSVLHEVFDKGQGQVRHQIAIRCDNDNVWRQIQEETLYSVINLVLWPICGLINDQLKEDLQ